MNSPSIPYHDTTRERLQRGITTLAEAVRVTLGPRGRTVIIEREFGPPQIVNSGVVVARAVHLPDAFENMGAQLLREVAARTSELAGDGTTTFTVLAHSMVQEGLKYLAAGMNPMVIAEDIDSDALATLVINSVRGAIKTCAVKAPGFGDRRKAMPQDMAALTGGKVISDELGRSLAKAALDDLGQAKRIEVDKDSTTLIGGGGNRSALQARMALIRQERDRSATEYERKQLDERLSRLAGGVALIKVGAATETELKERKLRVKDALQSASLDENSGVRIIARALEEPLRSILVHAGEEPDVVLHQVLAAEERNYGYNAATRDYGDLLAMGVIDPAKVTRLALQNAASNASLILSIDRMIAVGAQRTGTAAALPRTDPTPY
jgi:chaperonin GroEL